MQIKTVGSSVNSSSWRGLKFSEEQTTRERDNQIETPHPMASQYLARGLSANVLDDGVTVDISLG